MTLPVLAVVGPTASGKSDVAEAIADRIPAELISADSTQLYRGLPLITNQPSRPTKLVAIWPLEHEASVAEYQELAHAAIDDALAQGRTPVVAGGTWLYVRAALGGLALPPPPAAGVRERWQQAYDRDGADRAHALLAEKDPAAAARVHPNDRRRIVRALELAEAGHSLAGDELWTAAWRHPTLVVGLDVPPEEVSRRIAERTRRQFDAGLEEEVQAALAQPISSTARKIMGMDFVGRLSRPEAEAEFALRNRRLAAYQRKWLRRIPGLVSVRGDRPADEVADEILALASARERLPADH